MNKVKITLLFFYPSNSVVQCSAGGGYIANNTDCNDGDSGTNPGVTLDPCDGGNQDCDGATDENPDRTFYRDFDGDGFGNPSNQSAQCGAGGGYIADNSDCNDNNSAINPDADDDCGGGNEDCDGSTDEDFAASCSGYDDLSVCNGGNPGTRSCFDEGKTCDDGDCIGICSFGDTQCVPNVAAYQLCDGMGEYSLTFDCPYTNQDTFQICRNDACTPSLLVTRGNTDLVNSNERLDLFANEWAVSSFEVTRDIRVYALHAILDSVPGSGSARIAIWNDNGTGNAPGTRRTWTSVTTVGNGDNGINLSGSRVVNLYAGTRYWIGINVSTDGMELYFEDILDNSGDDYNFWYDPPTTNLSATVPTFDSLSGWFRGDGRFGLFVEGKELY